MSEIETFDELEAGLRRAFHHEPLPMAPDRLRDGLVEVVDRRAPGATARRGSRSALGILGLAAVLVVGGALAIVGGGGIRPGPSRPGDASPSGIHATRITYAIEWTAAEPASGEAHTRVVRVLRDRLSAIGLAPVIVASVDADRIAVDVPADSDLDRVRRVLGSVGRIEFVPLGSVEVEAGQSIDPSLPPLFGGDQIESASIGTDQVGSRVVTFRLAAEGTRLFGEWTRDHIGEVFAIVVDGTILSAPRINAEIPGGDVEISQPGGWDLTEADNLVALLDSGELPVAIRELSVASVGPILPAETSSSLRSADAPSAVPAESSLPSAPRATADCPAPVAAGGPVMACRAAVDTALGLLPPGVTPVGPIEFSHACVDVTGRGAQLDCLADAFGLVTITLSSAERLVVQTSLGHPGAQVVAPLGGDGASQVASVPGPLVACQGDIEAARYILRIDPTTRPAVWLETAGGDRRDVRFARPVVGLARPFPMILSAPDAFVSGRWFLGGEGTTVETGADLSGGAPRLFVCGAVDGALILDVAGV
jgi:hypothetical protein